MIGMRIGELMLGQRMVRPSELQKCLDEQASQQRRLVSLLIRAGSLEFDDGSRALGEQHGMPCVLAKHLAARDRSLAHAIPAELARAWCALPIGRAKGALVVCVRDPGEALKKQIEQTIRGDVMLVISPALRLEGLVAETYGPAPDEEFDVPLDSAVDLDPAPAPGKKPAPPAMPPMPDMDALDPESVRLALTDLDDARVTKDVAHTAQLAVAAAKAGTAPLASTSTTTPPPATSKRTKLPPAAPTMSATAEALELVSTRDDAAEAVIRFMTGHWTSGLVLAIRDEAAIGYRGHGNAIGAVDRIVLPLLTPSTMQRAVETKRTAIVGEPSSVQDELVKRLGSQSPAAAPVLVGGQVVAVIVVGDPIAGRLADTDRSIAELGRLAQMLGAAWERMLGSR